MKTLPIQDQTFRYTSTADDDLELLRVQLLSAIAAGKRRLTLDVDALPSLGELGVRMLIIIHRLVRGAGGEIVLHVTRPDVERLLRNLGLNKVFRM